MIIHFFKLNIGKEIIIGRINTISTSKIKKIIAIMKKCSENGIRLCDCGSNPHSKGEFFSLLNWIFFDKKIEINIMILVIIINNKFRYLINLIIYIKFLIFTIGSCIYFIYYINNLLIYSSSIYWNI